jgi:hypothetical protein
MSSLNLQSVDNEIVLWEPKTKDQNPGEVIYFNFYKSLELSTLYLYLSKLVVVLLYYKWSCPYYVFL